MTALAVTLVARQHQAAVVKSQHQLATMDAAIHALQPVTAGCLADSKHITAIADALLHQAVVAKSQILAVVVKLQHLLVVVDVEMYADATTAASRVAAHLWNCVERPSAIGASSPAIALVALHRAVAKSQILAAAVKLQPLLAAVVAAQLLAAAVKSRHVTHAVLQAVIAVAIVVADANVVVC